MYKSKVEFNYRADGNYNREIMRFLNYVIELPSIKVETSNETMFKTFYTDMENFFKNVED